MSIFLLSRADRPQDGADRFRHLAAAQGLHPLPEQRVGNWILHLVETANDTGIVRMEPRPGLLLISVGLFLYRGRRGVEALQHCHETLEQDRFDRRDTQGHFTLLRIEDNEVTLLNDGLGAHKIYHDAERSLFSNSFLAVLCCLERPRIDPTGALVYAFAGSCYGGRTFVEDLSFLPADCRLRLGQSAHAASLPPVIDHDPPADECSLDEAVTNNLDALRSTIAPLGAFADGRVRLSFSGGYDSRLLLALFMEQGIHPELYVYGPRGDIDVRIAERVADAEGLTLRHVDKGRTATPSGDGFAAAVDAALVHFDGWKNTGLFDNGADVPDRHSRHEGGFLPVNGGLGEIYRNFFSLDDRHYRAEDIVASFYRGFDPRWVRDRGIIGNYGAELARRMREQLNAGPGPLTSQQAQLLYPLFRGRFWTAREAEINQRFGPMAFPFLEHRLIRAAAGVPVTLKDYGRLQAAMITKLSPRLAGLPTGYGFAFDSPPAWRYRLDTWSTLRRPIWLRRHIRILKRRRHRLHRPAWLEESRLRVIMDPSLPFVRKLFAVERVNDADTLNRIVTMDFLAQRFNFRD